MRVLFFLMVFSFLAAGEGENAKMDRLEMPDGKLYEDVTITGYDAAYLEFMHKSGAARIKLRDCSKVVQRDYGYDKGKADAFLKRERKAEIKRRKIAAIRRAEHAAKQAKAKRKGELIKLQKKLVKPMKFHVIQAQKDGNALCKIQVHVKRSKVIKERYALGVRDKVVRYTTWIWLERDDQWFYVKGLGSVRDKEVVGGYGIVMSDNFSYESVGRGLKTVPVVEVRDKNGAPIESFNDDDTFIK